MIIMLFFNDIIIVKWKKSCFHLKISLQKIDNEI